MKKKCMVYKYSDSNLDLIDYRMLPPKIVSPVEKPDLELIQRDIDEIEIIKGFDFSFFTPSLVSVQLNAAKPAILRCKELTMKLTELAKKQKNASSNKGHDQLLQDSFILYEFLESAQVAIVFSFTAIETFFNLSIPEDYEYRKNGSKKTEIFNKSQIERYVSWKEKLKNIIPDIYKIEDISSTPFWGRIHQLIGIRNDIVHQKSSDDTEIVQRLINLDIPMVCFAAIELIKHVYDEASKNESIPACCERFPIVSVGSDSNVWFVKKVSNLEPIIGA